MWIERIGLRMGPLEGDLQGRPAWARYGVAILSVALGWLGREALGFGVGPTALPFVFFFPAVAIAAWCGGWGAGLLAIILSGLMANWSFQGPAGTLGVHSLAQALALVSFGIGALIIVAAIQRMHRARARLTGEAGERKKADEALRQAHEDLAEDVGALTRINRIAARFVSAETMQEVLEEILDAAIFVTHAEKGNIQLFDAKTRTLRIATARGLSDGWLKFFNVVHDDDAACAVAMAERRRVIVEDVRTNPIFVGRPALQMQLAEGVLAVQSTPLIGPTGELLGMLSTHFGEPHRCTERQLHWLDALAGQAAGLVGRRRTEQALREAHEQLASRAVQLDRLVEARTAKLQEMVGELEAFSYSISHDMRAPLRAMSSYASIVTEEHGKNIGPEGVELLKKIKEGSVRLDRLITDVLAYSRVVRSEMKLERVDVDRLVREIVEQYREWRPPKAEIRIEGPLGAVMGNEALLSQCITNLIGNAVKFVAPKTMARVRIRSESLRSGEEERVRILFEDNGIGIAPADQGRIFKLFERVHGPEFEGTGIGLSIVRKAVERMGGEFGLQSEAGKGSTFWIELRKAE